MDSLDFGSTPYTYTQPIPLYQEGPAFLLYPPTFFASPYGDTTSTSALPLTGRITELQSQSQGRQVFFIPYFQNPNGEMTPIFSTFYYMPIPTAQTHEELPENRREPLPLSSPPTQLSPSEQSDLEEESRSSPSSETPSSQRNPKIDWFFALPEEIFLCSSWKESLSLDIQKDVIGTCETTQEWESVINKLLPYLREITCSNKGNYIIRALLKHAPSTLLRGVIDFLIKNTLPLAKNRCGSSVYQRLIERDGLLTKEDFMNLARNMGCLSDFARSYYGNYAMKSLLSRGSDEIKEMVLLSIDAEIDDQTAKYLNIGLYHILSMLVPMVYEHAYLCQKYSNFSLKVFRFIEKYLDQWNTNTKKQALFILLHILCYGNSELKEKCMQIVIDNQNFLRRNHRDKISSIILECKLDAPPLSTISREFVQLAKTPLEEDYAD